MSLIGVVRQELAALTQQEAAYGFGSMDERFAALVAQRRFTMFLLVVFAVAALLLASVGLYGTLAHAVAQRTGEIGIRMALGAGRGDVLRLVLRQGMTLTIIGLGAGVAVSLASSRALASMLYETSPVDLGAFGGVSLVLAVVALLACYIPARRAARVDPMVALRCE
jgi:putative ABC transport system permease protein